MDGQLVGSNNSMSLAPGDLSGFPNNYLGKSQYDNPYLDGSINEFRIWSGALTAEEVAAHEVLGPGTVVPEPAGASLFIVFGMALLAGRKQYKFQVRAHVLAE